MQKKKSSWPKYLLVAVAIVAAYFINVEIQTRLGEKALAATGLPENTYHEALSQAVEQDKLILADLSAIWCPTCRNVDKFVLSNEKVKQAIEDKYVFTRIEYETDEGMAFRERYDVTTFPTLLLLSPDGQVVRELPVTTDPEEFLAAL